jgi:hypothetical protein
LRENNVNKKRIKFGYSADMRDARPFVALLLNRFFALGLSLSSQQPLSLPLTGRRVELTWPYTSTPGPIVKDQEETVLKVLVKKGEWLSGQKLSDRRVGEILDVLDSIRELPRRDLTLAQAMSLRKQLLVQKLIASSWRLNDDRPGAIGAKVSAQYKRGAKVTAIAQRVDMPAVALLRSIFMERSKERWPQMRHGDHRDIIKIARRLEGDQTQPEPAPESAEPEAGEGEVGRRKSLAALSKCAAELLTDRDRQELGEAKEADGISWNEENIEERNVSLAWEESLYAYLAANGVAFLTEGALLDLGFRSTPDAILLDDLYINGRLVRWLDAKCFYGSSRSKLFLTKLKKQCDRYKRDFGGGGAICYKLGFSRDLQAQLAGCETVCLDRGLLVLPSTDKDIRE